MYVKRRKRTVAVKLTATVLLVLNRSADLDAIWQVDLWGPMTLRCVRLGSLAPQGRRFEGRTHSQNMQLQIAVSTWRIQTRSNSAFCQITFWFLLHFADYVPNIEKRSIMASV